MRLLYLALGRDLRKPDAGSTHTINIVKALSKLGIKVTLAAANTGADLPGITTIDVDLPRKKTLWPPADVIDSLARAASGVELIQERAEESGGVGLKLAEALNRHLILEINTPLSGHPSPVIRRLADWNLRRQARQVSGIITQTSISRNIIESYSDKPVYVVPNGADPDLFSPDVPPAALPIGDPGGRCIVAFAGSMKPWHGVSVLVQAGAMILTAVRDAFFLFIGGGEALGELASLAERELGEGNFHFTGPVEPAEVPGYLAAADLLVAPFAPDRDPVRAYQFAKHGMWWSPVKVFEYMAMGKPIVASAAGPVPEYLTQSAIAVPPGEVVSLARGVTRLLEDPELAATLGRRARKRLLKHYTWRRAAEATVAAWNDILSGRQTVSLTR